MFTPGLLGRLATETGKAKLTWALIAFGVVLVLLFLGFVIVERTWGWPEWLTVDELQRWPVIDREHR